MVAQVVIFTVFVVSEVILPCSHMPVVGPYLNKLGVHYISIRLILIILFSWV